MRRDYKSISGGGVLPAGYAECKYIESTGIQYIRTSINVRNIKTYQAIALDLIDSTKVNTICGCTLEFYPLSFAAFELGKISSCFSRKWYGTNSFDTSEFVDIKFVQNGVNSKLYVNGELATINAGNAGTYSYPTIRVPNSNLIVFSADGYWYSQIKLKHLTLYSANDSAIADMYPALRLSDNKPGLYDLCGSICPLTGTPFYVNAGSGEFLYKLK